VGRGAAGGGRRGGGGQRKREGRANAVLDRFKIDIRTFSDRRRAYREQSTGAGKGQKNEINKKKGRKEEKKKKPKGKTQREDDHSKEQGMKH